jgi:hypothetical protein
LGVMPATRAMGFNCAPLPLSSISDISDMLSCRILSRQFPLCLPTTAAM